MAKEEGVYVTYKAFDKDLKCNGFQYEIGKSYHTEEDINLIHHGFHGCITPLGLLSYYCKHRENYRRFAIVGRLYDKEKQKFLPNLKKKLQMRNINMFYSPTHYDPLLRSHSTKNFSRTASCGFFSPNRIGSPIIPSVKLNLRVVKKKRINK